MKVGIFHRYPIDLVIGTNPAFPVIIKSLESNGGEIYFVSFTGNNKAKHKNIRFREIELDFNRESSRDKLLKTLLWILFTPFSARRLVKKDKVRRIYCDDSIPFYAFFIKLFVGRKCKVLMRLGDLQTGYLFADQGIFRGIVFKIISFFEVLMWKKMDGIIAISPPFKKFIIESGVSPEKVSVVRECIDLDMFSPGQTNIRKEHGISNDDIVVMFHGAIVPCKGTTVLLEAIKKVLKNFSNLKCMIVGDGSSFKEATDFVENNNLKGNVILIGWVDFKLVPNFINGADIGIALRNNNMANNFVVTTALLQYWACKKPLLVPRLDAMEEIVDDGVNGILFEPGDADSLAEKIEFLIKNKNMWHSLGENGRKTASKYFDKTKIGQEMSKAILHL